MDVVIDEGGGSSQAYVEDCPVCCRPWQVEVMHDPELGRVANKIFEFHMSAGRKVQIEFIGRSGG